MTWRSSAQDFPRNNGLQTWT